MHPMPVGRQDRDEKGRRKRGQGEEQRGGEGWRLA